MITLSRMFVRNIVLTILTLIVITFPIVLLCYRTLDITYLMTSMMFALPIAFLISSIKNHFIFTILLSLLLVICLVEQVMVIDFQTFIKSGNILAFLQTTSKESASFVKNNIVILVYFLPVIIVFSTALWLHSHIQINRKTQYIGLMVSIVVALGYITYKQVVFYDGTLTNRYYIEKNILTRPPYNMFFQIRNTIITEKMRKYIRESENFTFNSIRDFDVTRKEIYVFGIGESMNYDHASLNNQYNRETMPRLKVLDNLVSYSNYYSGACLTMWSVPQLITRATPDDYIMSYKEKSIIQPFKEIGFKTYVIECHNLLGYETYLTSGVDSLIHVKKDIDIPRIIDSLSSIYPKTFFIAEFLGCHSYYYNYEKEFDVFHPNINSESKVKSDSLYINAYDNTILYADYVLSEIIRKIDKPEVSSSFIFVSDHGEGLSANGGGHGGDCEPKKCEYHVPFFIWYSSEYAVLFSEKVDNMVDNKDMPVNSDNIFYSLCDMAGIKVADDYWRANYSIFSSELDYHTRKVLLPDGTNTLECE